MTVVVAVQDGARSRAAIRAAALEAGFRQATLFHPGWRGQRRWVLPRLARECGQAPGATAPSRRVAVKVLLHPANA